jgi:peptidoglycan/xylan/chitin deacetylase (PgdA/CDA1 family)
MAHEVRAVEARGQDTQVRAATLLYHDVVENGRDDESGFTGPGPLRYKLDTRDFERHLLELDRRIRRPPFTVDELGSRSPELPWLLTFDDGGASAVSIGERLAERGWRGHFFITVDWIGRPGFVDASTIRVLDEMDHVVGSHSCSHPERMVRCTWDELLHEWGHSRDVLAEIVGKPVTIASVPAGHYGVAVARAAAAVGIRTLFTSEPVLKARVVDGCLVLGRFAIRRGMAAETAAALARGDGPPRLRQFASWNTKKVVKKVGGTTYWRLRRFLLSRR